MGADTIQDVIVETLTLVKPVKLGKTTIASPVNNENQALMSA